MLHNMRPVSRDDIDRIVALAESVADADEPDSVVTREMVAAQFDIPGMDITEYSWVLPDTSGRLIASVAAVPMPTDEDETVHLSWTVHPEHRSHDFHEHLLRFAEEKAQTVRRMRHMPGWFHVGLRPVHSDRYALLERYGYSPKRWFLEMERHLDNMPEAVLPEGFTMDDATATGAGGDVYSTLEESFRDHWHQAHFTREQYDHFLAMLAQAPMLTLLARDSAGEPAGACLARLSAEKNARNGTAEGEVAILGVRRPYRNRGLGRALLARSLAWLRECGMNTATIDVDADSPTGANRLYAAVGFVERRRSVVYMKPMP
jgi:mycothiol synthase